MAKYKDLIQRSFIEDYVDIPDEAKEELEVVYAKASEYDEEHQVFSRFLHTINNDNMSDTEKLIEMINLSNDYKAYKRIQQLNEQEADY